MLTNITQNAEILIRFIGNESTSFFLVEHNRQLTPGSINEFSYRGNEYVTGVNSFLMFKSDIFLRMFFS